MTVDDETFQLLGAYRDGELSPAESLAMDRRLADDPELRILAERLGTLSATVKEALARPAPSPALRSRVIQQLGFRDPPARRRWPDHWRSLAAVLVAGVIGGGVLGGAGAYLALAPGGEATADAVLAGHLRGLVAEQPFDIASSNRHVVKPWFNGRTTIAPQAPDFAAQGFPLAGGRIDIVDGKPVPTLVYRHDQHVISVTITPHTGADATAEMRRDGSTIERWSAGDLVYWAVSDLDRQELRGFVDLFRAEVARDG